MTPAAYVTHAQPGRMRLKISRTGRDASFFARIGQILRSHPDVIRVVTNVLTGSVLFEHCGDLGTILAFAKEMGLFDVGEKLDVPPHEKEPVEPPARDHLRLGRGRELGDAGVLVGVTLLGFAAVQARRGKFLPAGLTLVFNAIDFLQRWENGIGPRSVSSCRGQCPEGICTLQTKWERC